MLDVGRPAVAVLILAMCAPGEHYLAVQAGWSHTLAWGMPSALTAYAGIAAVVATKRPKGAPGRKTAVWGAVLAVSAAMAAQPIAHLYGRQNLTSQEVSLIVAMGVIPGAVFGHLLHMGAAAPKPARRTVSKPDKSSKRTTHADKPLVHVDIEEAVSAGQPDWTKGRMTGLAADMDSNPQWLADNRTAADAAGLSVSELMDAPDSPPDAMTWTDAAVSAGVLSRTAPVRSVRDGSMSGLALSMILDNEDVTDEDIRTAVLDKFGQDTKTNSIYRAITRARQKAEKTA
jgi:hypothetical protein